MLRSIVFFLKSFASKLSRFWWLTIEALAEAGDWTELDRFSKSQKSPIGYEVRNLAVVT